MEITRSGATFRAIRHRSSRPLEPSAGFHILPGDHRQQRQRGRSVDPTGQAAPDGRCVGSPINAFAITFGDRWPAAETS